jgi:hypothetical protein
MLTIKGHFYFKPLQLQATESFEITVDHADLYHVPSKFHADNMLVKQAIQEKYGTDEKVIDDFFVIDSIQK